MDAEKQRLNLLLFYALVLLMVYLCARIVAPFLMPLVWAGILALCAQPLQRRLLARVKPAPAALLSTVAVAVLLIIPAVLLAIGLVGQISAGLTGLQGTLATIHENEKLLSAWAWIEAHVPAVALAKIQARLAEIAPKLTRFVAGQAGSALQTSSVFLFKLFVTLFALFFFLRDGRELGKVIRNLLPFTPKRNEELITRTSDLVFAGSMATLTVAAAQGVAGGILFAILGLQAPLFWGVVMGFCALLPLFGTALIWAPAAIGLIVVGSWVKGVILIVLGIALVGGMDNFLRPALVSGKTEMNGLMVFISILGGVTAFGFVGLVLGPVIVAAAISILQIGASSETTG
jgi:predicted PurR-regulated permease PerM